jgi:hypothetical protein
MHNLRLCIHILHGFYMDKIAKFPNIVLEFKSYCTHMLL